MKLFANFRRLSTKASTNVRSRQELPQCRGQRTDILYRNEAAINPVLDEVGGTGRAVRADRFTVSGGKFSISSSP